jgi:Leucine-rich repeat (LRR) protein
MDFMDCEFLKTTPDVSSIPNLEELIFDMCTNLVEIHHSVGRHDKLVRLSVKECNNLSNFPRSIHMRSLKDLNVNGCSSLSNFPVIECEMKSLTSIKFGGTGIKELPPSIRYLTGLQILSLDGCINLTNLPSSIYELQHLEYLLLSGCSNLVTFPRKIRDISPTYPYGISVLG